MINSKRNSEAEIIKYYTLIRKLKNDELFTKYGLLLLIVSIFLGSIIKLYYITIPLIMIPYYLIYYFFDFKSKIKNRLISIFIAKCNDYVTVHNKEDLKKCIEEIVETKDLEYMLNIINNSVDLNH